MQKIVLFVSDNVTQRQLTPLLEQNYVVSTGEASGLRKEDFDLCVLDRQTLDKLLAKAAISHSSTEELERLADFSRLNPNPVLEFSAHGELTYANDAAQKLAVLAGQSLPEILPPQTNAIVHECLATSRSKLRFETRLGQRTISWSFFPIPNHNSVHCYAADITERLNLEAQLRQSQKLEAIGQLAGGIAHDFNNMLTAILGHSSLLLAENDQSPGNHEAVKQITKCAKRAANLTQQLLTFSRKQPLQPKALDLNELISNHTKMLRRIIGEDIKLNFTYSPHLPPVFGDSGMLEQVLLNLAVNARDAMPQGGQLTIGTSCVTINTDYTRKLPHARPGDFVRVFVTDTGGGIPAEVLPRIFEPFFTTKDVGKGTGLGLATTHGIIQQHEGWIEVESIEGVGSNFILYLPARADLERVIQPERESSLMKGQGETILLVEDEAAVRELARTALEHCQYKVLESSSGVAAREIWRHHRAKIDLLLTDMVMPDGVNGRVLAEELRAEKPGLKVLLVTGYSFEQVDAMWANGSGIHHLQKPFTLPALAEAVRDCLEGKPVGASR